MLEQSGVPLHERNKSKWGKVSSDNPVLICSFTTYRKSIIIQTFVNSFKRCSKYGGGPVKLYKIWG